MIETAPARIGGGGFGAVIDRLIRGCVQQAAELQNLPFEEITRIVAPYDTQRGALEALRASANAGAGRISAGWPQDEPVPPRARLEAAEQAIDTASCAAVRHATGAIRPALIQFYEALDQGQKLHFARVL